ncbi:uncharacterized protein LACBIDRAFT_327108 [Laccaria bicolor S238N-H82]|uniref:Predicted protein n=1 Tax=Laccaria bicolor (strain S238N-H82 / ATCC MYA-4686) TaxID=486041 RepID=B0DAN7_LACBS|nr:uncharacterized protein LACBIDRAFT_327108 [Laccaria bicolor S238N-H82]EDR08565.1 predicted protein [Laccaria bicolor S238N-H82]|eukprot:XP_001880790.1 predicted protein [Laccaria bicolor S238N-H82]
MALTQALEEISEQEAEQNIPLSSPQGLSVEIRVRISVIGSYSFDTSQIPMTHETFPHQMIGKCSLLVEWYIAVLASPNTMKVLCQYPFDFHDLKLVQIFPHSVKMLPKTVYETDLNLLRFLWSRARSDTPTLREDAPQNHLRIGQGLVELGSQSASFSDLNLLRFLWSRVRSDTPTLHEDAPQNRLRNGQGLMELGPQSASFSVVEGSFGYPHTP